METPIWASLLVESKLLNPKCLHNGPRFKYGIWSDANVVPFSSQILLKTSPPPNPKSQLLSLGPNIESKNEVHL